MIRETNCSKKKRERERSYPKGREEKPREARRGDEASKSEKWREKLREGENL